MQSITYVVLFVAATTLPLWHYHKEKHGLSVTQGILSLFCSINLMICIWELSLWYCRNIVKAQYQNMKKLLPRETLPQPFFLFEEVKLRTAFTLQHWSKVWSTYSLMDPSYSEQNSFGFWIDVGNGHVTLIPTILFAVGMTWDILSARLLGTISLVYFWQMMYGTVLYFSAYFHNARWRGRPGLLIVLVSNFIWIAAPLLGMYVSYHMIQDNNYKLVRGQSTA